MKEFDDSIMTYIDPFLKRYFNRDITHEDLMVITDNISVKAMPKGTVLIKEGEIHNYGYFLIEGLSRSFYLKNGVEVNFWFDRENNPIGSLESYFGRESKVSVELLEDSILLKSDINALRKEAEVSFATNYFLRSVIEEYAQFMERRLYALQYKTSKERYKYFLENEPDLLRRVSLTHIASYLGISRETLSRLRSEMIL
jgi:CRP-like cAMP-binding protein